MRLRDTELYHEQRLDDTGTKIMDLTFKDPLTAISLQFKGTNGATSNKSNWLNDIVTRIEIVDGSDVLLSTSLKELQALMAYKSGHMPYMLLNEGPSADQWDTATIEFGRYIGDPEYFMDLTKFRNPQLKITTNEDVIRAMGDTGFVTGTLKVSVVAHVIEEGAKSSLGFVMPKEIYNFTTQSSGDEHIDLPIDYPYMGLMIHSVDKQIGIEDLITALKISCDSDKFIPFSRYTDDLQRAMKRMQGVLSAPYSMYRKDSETVNIPLYRDVTVQAIAKSTGIVPAVTDIGPGYVTIGLDSITASHTHHAIQVNGSETAADETAFVSISDGAGAAVTPAVQVGNAGGGSNFFVDTDAADVMAAVNSELAILARIAGRSPHNTLYIPFGVPGEPESMFKPTDWHSIRLACTQGAMGSAAVCLVQLRTLATK